MVDKQAYLHNLRHSAAHVLAQAVLQLYPGTKITIGPVTDTGFFYDFLPVQSFKEEDLVKIEARMRELIAKNYQITGKQVAKDEARKIWTDNPFKLELINDIPADTVGVYSQAEFTDLCRGGHLDYIGEIKYFKLTTISGSYWRARRDGQALQRITGVAFATQEDMDAYFKMIEDAEKYDHRRLGKELDLFSFHDEAAGMPFFHAKGLQLYNGLINYLRKLRGSEYQEIRTPILLDESLWKTSGHYEFYKKNMYFTQIDEGHSCVRPMNCPGSVLIYREKPRSYRELPMRIAEFGYVHRYELSGVLHGLFRVRAFTIDDLHIYAMIDQVEAEVDRCITLANRVYNAFGFKNIQFAISTRPEVSMGTDENWEKATTALTSALDRNGIAYEIHEGEGAFYGPKIEIKVEDNMGRRWQCGTVQVDFNMPINFDLNYVAADQSRQRPVMVHCAIFGSLERFIGVILEHFKGRLPFWIAPVQVRVLMISEKQADYAKGVADALRAGGLRVELEHSNDQISAQIRKAQMDKIPWMVVVGQKEVDQGTVTLRDLDGKQQFGQTVASLVQLAAELNQN
ncbi:threonine--tRNA ligase [Candidatus Dependentiae bacterium]|nr:threonine--tRNA ligase [Candidatus Dependentiae bacterium]